MGTSELKETLESQRAAVISADRKGALKLPQNPTGNLTPCWYELAGKTFEIYQDPFEPNLPMVSEVFYIRLNVDSFGFGLETEGHFETIDEACAHIDQKVALKLGQPEQQGKMQ